MFETDPEGAISAFYPGSSTSLELVYEEAVANAIDADATSITITIFINEFSDSDSLVLTIHDNGKGFTDGNYDNFCKLLKSKDANHKGIGRIAFLKYFEKVEVESYTGTFKRIFTFNNEFDKGKNEKEDSLHPSGTKLVFKGYRLDKIGSKDYIKPERVLNNLVEKFFVPLHVLKNQNIDFLLKVNLEINSPEPKNGLISQSLIFNLDNFPLLETKSVTDAELGLFDLFRLSYLVQPKPLYDATLNYNIFAVCIDNRTNSLGDIKINKLPSGYNYIFILESGYFNGQINASRTEISIQENVLKLAKKVFMNEVAQIINSRVPEVESNNAKISAGLAKRFPHLEDYFNKPLIGLIDRDKALDEAQRKYFSAQKSIFDKDIQNLSAEDYDKAIQLTSRVLMEYILYRNITISKLNNIRIGSSEAQIHNLITRMGAVHSEDEIHQSIFSNNPWVLDDKFMSYQKVLSDRDFDELLRNIAEENEIVATDQTRPDIAIIFSNDPKQDAPFDVVIVELKRPGLKLAAREEVESQLRQRARRIVNYYGTRIKRMWFYGIVDINKELIRSLKELGYKPLFSKGTVYYKQIMIEKDLEAQEIPTDFYLLDFKALIEDAEARNKAFMELLKSNMKGRTY